MVLARVLPACVVHEKLKFQFEFETANQPGFEPRSPGPKMAIQTIELHSIDQKYYCLSNYCLSVQLYFVLII